MFKDLFSNRLLIGALAFFVLCVCGSLLYMQHVEQQTAGDVAHTEARLKQLTEKQNQQLTAESPVGDTLQGGHWHGDEWHADPHETPVQDTTAGFSETETPAAPEPSAGDLKPRPGSFLERYLSQFSPASAKRAMSRWFEQAGVDPPPRGYEYIWDDPWVVKRDANGNPVINKIGEPYIQVHTITGFAPNPEQARRYKELEEQYLRTTDPNEETRIQAEQDQIEGEAQGPYPYVSAFASGREAQSKLSQRMREAEEKALVDFGLGHLVGTGIGGLPKPKPLPLEDED